MNQTEHVEKLVIDTLQRGSCSTAALIESIDRQRKGVTKQGVYRVLRKLKKEEKVVQHGRSVSLNIQWLRKMSDFFSIAQHYYSPRQSNPDFFLNLREKEKVTFTFKTLVDLDAFASHVIHMLAEIMGENEPVYVYNPHEVFAYGRKEAEEMLLDAFEKLHKKLFVLSTYHSPLDEALKKQFTGTHVEYHIEEDVPFDTETYYFNVYSDYLLEIRLDRHIAGEIHAFYAETKVFNAAAEQQLAQVFLTKGRHRLTLSRNKAKAARYKKFFAKYF